MGYICDCDVVCGSIRVEAGSREEAEEIAEARVRGLRVSDCEHVDCKCVGDDDHWEAGGHGGHDYGDGEEPWWG